MGSLVRSFHPRGILNRIVSVKSPDLKWTGAILPAFWIDFQILMNRRPKPFNLLIFDRQPDGSARSGLKLNSFRAQDLSLNFWTLFIISRNGIYKFFWEKYFELLHDLVD